MQAFPIRTPRELGRMIFAGLSSGRRAMYLRIGELALSGGNVRHKLKRCRHVRGLGLIEFEQ